jgi:exo-beta-1,3-glucanase (GH17 family)
VQPLEDRLLLADVSAPAILQYFEGSYRTIERRAADVFNAGYGIVYTPPPGRADQGSLSVGYDVYDRFDLGAAGNPTLYGSETGLRSAVEQIRRIGAQSFVDLVINHNGFSDSATHCDGHSFVNAGGYPGFIVTAGFDVDGDFHGAFESGDQNGRLAGLIDIAHEKNYQFVRSPVPGFAQNLPAGTVPACGRLANVPDESNRRLYPDGDLTPIRVFDPKTGETDIPIYPFNNASPLAGDPVAENALGLLMRNAQWLVQAVGIDGFRIDAAKHVAGFVLDYLDRALYRSNPRLLLDGSQPNVFSFSEVFDGSKSYLQTFIRKDINPSDPGRVGGNRDVLDFPLFFALRDNLTGNGFQNDWANIVGASQDSQDDGLANNGSQAVSFVSSHDEFGPYLSNVAYAYTLLRPGNAIVYFNAKEFGSGRDFPKDGRGDALGGLFGNTIATLVNLRNTHGRGNYIERFREKEFLIYERDRSAVVVLSNRLDGGFDARTIQTSFAEGTPLMELTGNAADPVVDPFNDFPELLVVNAGGTANLRVPRNTAPNGTEHGRGYFIYGLAAPQGTLTLTNVAATLPGEPPSSASNGTARLSPIDIVTADSFQVRLATNAVNLLGTVRDRPADGDNALLRLDAGIDLNGNGMVDYRLPGSVTYGFEEFSDVKTPGYLAADGNGLYVETIDTTGLSEGMHYVEVRAFRHREPAEGEAIYAPFRRAVYVDRLPAVSAVDSFNPIVPGTNENRRLVVRSTDRTADNVHVFFDLPAGLSDADVLAMVGTVSQTTQTDRDLFTKDATGLTHGNHVATLVTYEISGRAHVQRVPGLFTSTVFGAGLGDLDFDGSYTPDDIDDFRAVLFSHDDQFNPAADLDGNGRVNLTDLTLLDARLTAVGAGATTRQAYQDLVASLTLTVSVTPSTFGENGGPAAATATVTRNRAFDNGSLRVTLTSLDTSEATVPATLTIPAGQAAASFAIDAIDDTLLDGTQTFALRAAAPDYYDATPTITVTDHETLTLAITADSVAENAGMSATTATVTRSNSDNGSDLIVSLISSDPSELAGPATVTIPAGQASVSFALHAVDDLQPDGTRNVTLNAAAAGYQGGSDTLAVSDNETLREVCMPAGPVVDALQTCRNWITYAPSRPYNPDTGTYPNEDQLRANLQQLFDEGFRGLVTYSLDGTLREVPRIAKEVGFAQVIAGIFWFDSAQLAREKSAAQEELPFIDAFILGNEGLLFGRYTRSDLEREIAALRTLTGRPVTTTETGGQYLADPSLAAVGDFVMPNIHPWFANVRTIPEAVQFTANELQAIRAIVAPGRAVVVKESWWPTGGGDPAATEANQIAYFDGLAATSVHFLPGESFDQFWKTAEGTQGPHWGYHSDVAAPKPIVAALHDDYVCSYVAGLLLVLDRAAAPENAGAGAATGTVTRCSSNTTGPLVVTLASSDATAATVPAIVTIPAGQALATFPLDAVDDSLLDGPQTVTITASAAGFVGGTDTLQVADHEVLTLSLSTGAIAENAGNAAATLTVSRGNSDIAAPLTVTLTSTDPSEATLPATVVIPADQSSASVAVAAIDDTLLDGDQMLTLQASAGGYVSAAAPLTVRDFETVTVTLSAAAVAENAGPNAATGTVTRSNSDTAAELVVTLASSDMTEATVPAGVTIPAGQSAATFAIAAADDALLDGLQTVSITASAAGYVAGPATLDVTDFETLTIVFADAAIAENAGLGATTATVSRSNLADLSQLLTVTLGNGDDTELLLPAALAIPAGQASAGFTVHAVDDRLLDGTQTVPVSATAAGYLAGSATIDVTDHETLSVTVVQSSVAENAGNAARTITVTRSNSDDLAAPLVVALGNSDATELAIAASATIPAGQAATTVSVDALDDALLDGSQLVMVTASAAGYVAGSVEITVTDHETLQLVLAANSIAESAGLGATTATVSRSNVADLSAPLVVTLAGSDPTEATVPASVVIPAGQAAVTVPVDAVDDARLDGPQTVTVTASAAGYVSGSAMLEVTDHETLTLTIAAASIAENAGPAAATATVTRSTTGDLGTALVVTIGNSDATEVNAPATVTIPAGQASATFPLDAADDAILDGSQVVTITVSAAGFAGDGDTVEVTDHETLTLVIAPRSIAENAGPAAATTTVTRSTTDDLSSALVVTIGNSDLTELSVPATVTIPAGQASATFSIDAVDDARLDGPQSVTIAASAAGFVADSAALEVTDHEVLTLAITPAAVAESAGAVAATATVTRSTSDELTAALLVTIGNSDPTEAHAPATVTIPAGQASTTFAVAALDDSMEDGAQTATITASAAGFVSGSAELTVTDQPFLTVVVDVRTFAENAGVAAATATLTRANTADLAEPLDVTVDSSDASELRVPTLVTIPAGQASTTFAIDARDDQLFDGSQTVVVTASGAGYLSGAATLEVSDHETLALTVAAASVAENAGPGATTITLSRSNVADLAAPLLVTLATSDPTEAAVPASALIPAGQAAVTVPVDAVDDDLLDGLQSVAFTVSAAGYLPGAGTLDVRDHEILTLMLSAPVIAENAGSSAATLTVTRGNSDIASPLTVMLLSGDPSEAGLPATLLIPAGQASAAAAVHAVDDSLLDGEQAVSLQAAAAGYVPAAVVLRVSDFETVTVTLSAGSVSENAGPNAATGTVTRGNSDTAAALLVLLASSDTSAATVPASVTIAAGEAAATFAIAASDDARLDGLQSTTITPSAAGYVASPATLDVADFERLTIGFAVVAIAEDAGQAATTATVSRSNIDDLSQPLVVTLLNGDDSELLVPASVSIAVGQVSATFPVDAVDDALLDGTETVRVTVAAPGYSAGSADLEVSDVETLSLSLARHTVSEGAGAAAVLATVTRNNTDIAGPLVVMLTSSDPGTATVPTQVTIAAALNSTTFSVDTVDDSMLEDAVLVTLTARSAGYGDATAALQVTDDEFRPIRVAGRVFDDRNGNGLADPGDPPVAGRTVFFDSDGNGALTAGETATTTAPDGSYQFDALGPGTYRVRQSLPAGFRQTTDSPPDLVATGGVDLMGVDFGSFQRATVRGLKFDDENGNGQRDDGEPLLAGWTIFLDADGNGTLGGEPTQTTAADGTYSFSGLDLGTHVFREVPQPGWTQTAPAAFEHVVTVTASGDLFDNRDFGNADQTAPELAAVADVTIDTTDPAGMAVAFDLPAATDAVDSNPAVECTPPSGTLFPVGSTVVTCTARDRAGNSSSRSFHAMVRPAALDRFEPNPRGTPTSVGSVSESRLLAATSSTADRDWYAMTAAQTGVFTVLATPHDGASQIVIKIRRSGIPGTAARGVGRADVLATAGESFLVFVRARTVEPVFYDLHMLNQLHVAITNGLSVPAGRLTITGSGAADDIRIATSEAGLSATVNGVSYSAAQLTTLYGPAEITSIQAKGRGGADRIEVAKDVAIAARLVGGGGNDTLIGGGGADQLIAGAGDDSACGQAGDDVLRGQAGDDTLIGGPGRDSMTAELGLDLLLTDLDDLLVDLGSDGGMSRPDEGRACAE